MPRRAPLPDDLKQLCGLCREGKLFAVQDWITTGNRYHPPPGHWRTTPFAVAIQTGFHSLVEVFLRAGIEQSKKDLALFQATDNRKLGLVELLHAYGANPQAVDAQTVIDSRDPAIIRWFVRQGMDLETGSPIAYAFRWAHRDFLGVYMDVRDQVPSARKQAAMALRHHAGDGNLKWVSLLLWAGADPRLAVPDVDADPDYEEDEREEDKNAVYQAVVRGQAEVIKKFKLDPTKDDLPELLRWSGIACKPDVIQMILVLGSADQLSDPANEALKMAVHQLEWGLGSISGWGYGGYDRVESALKCIAVLAQHGARWNPPEIYEWSGLRRALGKTDDYRAIQTLKRLIDTGAIEQAVFAKLMSTPKMKEILSSSSPGVFALRKLAGFSFDKRRKSEMIHRCPPP